MWWNKEPAPFVEAATPVYDGIVADVDQLREQHEAFAEAANKDLAALCARVEKLEFLLHQRDSMGQGPAAVTRLPFREFKRLKESGSKSKGA